MRSCPFGSALCVLVEVVRVLENYQLVSVVVIRLSFSVMVFSCRGRGVLIGVDRPLFGLEQSVHDLLGWPWSFHLDPIAGRIECGLPGFHTVCQKERCVLDRGGVVTEHNGSQVVLPIQRGVADVGREVLGDRLVGNLCLAVALGVIGRGS